MLVGIWGVLEHPAPAPGTTTVAVSAPPVTVTNQIPPVTTTTVSVTGKTTSPTPTPTPTPVSSPLRPLPVDPYGAAPLDFGSGNDEVVMPAFETENANEAGARLHIVHLTLEPMGKVLGRNARQNGNAISDSEANAYRASVNNQQASVREAIEAAGATVVYSTQLASNTLIVSMTPAVAKNVAGFGGVKSVTAERLVPLRNVPSASQIGVTPAVRASVGVNGTGIHALVIDSGIDYTHIEFGGSGDPTDFRVNNPSVVEEGTFPTPKVIGGYDFVDDDPDPLDEYNMYALKQLNPGYGHGTHVAATLGGVLTGAAPGVSLSMARVCQSYASGASVCGIVPMLRAFDYALDPGMTGNVSTTVDLVSMSIGGIAPESDPFCDAIDVITNYGIPVFIAAGNDGDIPYVGGECANRASAISVAASTGAELGNRYPINISAPASIAGLYPVMAQEPWGPLQGTFHGKVASIGYGCIRGTFPKAREPGMVALAVGGGGCFAYTMAANAAREGYEYLFIGARGPRRPDMDPDVPSQHYTDGPDTIPSVVISNAAWLKMHNALLAGDIVRAGIQMDITATNSTTQHEIISFSSRGPSTAMGDVKPDIVAPGGWVNSAAIGTGTGYIRYSGTSMATPLAAGAAALLIETHPGITPGELKARLVNTGANDVRNYIYNGTLTPASVTRIGGGMVRFEAAAEVATTLVSNATGQPSLSFGYLKVPTASIVTRSLALAVTNLDSVSHTYTISHSFSFASDLASGAVTLTHPSSITVAGGATGVFNVTLTVTGAALPAWPYTPQDPAWHYTTSLLATRGKLQDVAEYDGYVTLAASGGDTVRVPWLVVPRRASNAAASASSLVLSSTTSTGSFNVANPGGIAASRVVLYSLLASGAPMAAVNDSYLASRAADLRYLGARSINNGNSIEVAVTLYNSMNNPLLMGLASGVNLFVYVQQGPHQVWSFYDMSTALVINQYGAFCWTYNTNTGARQASTCMVDLLTNTMTFAINTNVFGLKPTDPMTVGAVSLGTFTVPLGVQSVIDQLAGVFAPQQPRFVASPFDFYVNSSATVPVSVTGYAGIPSTVSTQSGFLAYYVHQGAAEAVLVS